MNKLINILSLFSAKDWHKTGLKDVQVTLRQLLLQLVLQLLQFVTEESLRCLFLECEYTKIYTFIEEIYCTTTENISIWQILFYIL